MLPFIYKSIVLAFIEPAKQFCHLKCAIEHGTYGNMVGHGVL